MRKAKRVRLGFEKSGDSLEGMSLIIETEAICYEWRGADGQFPDYEKLIPAEFGTVAHLDTVEASKAIASLKTISDNPKSYAIDLTIGEGKIIMANPDGKGEAIIPADTDGQGSVRIDGRYLAEALKACGGMVDFKLTNAYSPMLFASDGCQVVVMPMVTDMAKQAKEQAQAQVPAEVEGTPEAEAIAKAEEVVKATKPKRSRKKEPVAVA